MVVNIHVVFYTTFNQWLPNKERFESIGVPHPALTRKWIGSRFKTWRKTACRSLMRQRNTDFHYLVLCNNKTRVVCAKLFSGIDKRIVPIFTDIECAKWIAENLYGYEEVLAVRLDSDDMYRWDVVDHLYAWAKSSSKKYAYWPHGYAFDHVSKLLWVYETISSGPFFVHRWKLEELLKNGRIKDSLRHDKIKWAGSDRLPGREFCVTINHGLNDSTRFNRKRFYSVVDYERKSLVISNFGIPL